MYEVHFAESGAAELQISLQRLEDEFSDWSAQFEKLAPESTIVIHRIFEAEGPGWLQLRPATAAYKSRHYPGKTILRRKDALYLSFEKDAPGNVTIITALSGEYGSVVSYGIFHEADRPIIAKITEQDEDRFIEIVVRDKTEKMRELGFLIN